jgi:hypothetical protein
VLRYAKDVQTHFLDSGVDVYLQIDLDQNQSNQASAGGSNGANNQIASGGQSGAAGSHGASSYGASSHGGVNAHNATAGHHSNASGNIQNSGSGQHGASASSTYHSVSLGLGGKDNEIKTENLAEIITSSTSADFLIVIGDRNMKNQSCQVKKRGKLVEMDVFDMIRAIWNEWGPHQVEFEDLDPKLAPSAIIGLLTHAQLHLLLQRYPPHLNFEDLLKRAKETLEEIKSFVAASKSGSFGISGTGTAFSSTSMLSSSSSSSNQKAKKAAAFPSLMTASILSSNTFIFDEKQSAKFQSAQKNLVRIHKQVSSLRQLLNELPESRTEESFVINQEQFGRPVGPDYKPHHAILAQISSSLRQRFLSLLSHVESTTESFAADIVPLGAPIWASYIGSGSSSSSSSNQASSASTNASSGVNPGISQKSIQGTAADDSTTSASATSNNTNLSQSNAASNQSAKGAKTKTNASASGSASPSPIPSSDASNTASHSHQMGVGMSQGAGGANSGNFSGAVSGGPEGIYSGSGGTLTPRAIPVAALPTPGANEWACRYCTSFNLLQLKECTVCGLARMADKSRGDGDDDGSWETAGEKKAKKKAQQQQAPLSQSGASVGSASWQGGASVPSTPAAATGTSGSGAFSTSSFNAALADPHAAISSSNDALMALGVNGGAANPNHAQATAGGAQSANSQFSVASGASGGLAGDSSATGAASQPSAWSGKLNKATGATNPNSTAPGSGSLPAASKPVGASTPAGSQATASVGSATSTAAPTSGPKSKKLLDPIPGLAAAKEKQATTKGTSKEKSKDASASKEAKDSSFPASYSTVVSGALPHLSSSVGSPSPSSSPVLGLAHGVGMSGSGTFSISSASPSPPLSSPFAPGTPITILTNSSAHARGAAPGTASANASLTASNGALNPNLLSEIFALSASGASASAQGLNSSAGASHLGNSKNSGLVSLAASGGDAAAGNYALSSLSGLFGAGGASASGGSAAGSIPSYYFNLNNAGGFASDFSGFSRDVSATAPYVPSASGVASATDLGLASASSTSPSLVDHSYSDWKLAFADPAAAASGSGGGAASTGGASSAKSREAGMAAASGAASASRAQAQAGGGKNAWHAKHAGATAPAAGLRTPTKNQNASAHAPSTPTFTTPFKGAAAHAARHASHASMDQRGHHQTHTLDEYVQAEPKYGVKNPCWVCGEEATVECNLCPKVGMETFFCSGAHQQFIWKFHVRTCHPVSTALAVSFDTNSYHTGIPSHLASSSQHSIHHQSYNFDPVPYRPGNSSTHSDASSKSTVRDPPSQPPLPRYSSPSGRHKFS